MSNMFDLEGSFPGRCPHGPCVSITQLHGWTQAAQTRRLVPHRLTGGQTPEKKLEGKMSSRGSRDNTQNIPTILLQVDCGNDDWRASEPEQGGHQPVPGSDCGKESPHMHQCCGGPHEGKTLILLPIKPHSTFGFFSLVVKSQLPGQAQLKYWQRVSKKDL